MVPYSANIWQSPPGVPGVVAAWTVGAPHWTRLVVDATTGQNGLQQARLFAATAGVTGIALTKLDGSAKGGVAIAIAHELSIPVKLIGIGEGIDDLRPFDANDYARALVGTPTSNSCRCDVRRQAAEVRICPARTALYTSGPCSTRLRTGSRPSRTVMSFAEYDIRRRWYNDHGT